MGDTSSGDTERASLLPRRRAAIIAVALLLFIGGIAIWTQWPQGTLVEVTNETGAPLDRVLICNRLGVLAELGRIEPGARAAARVSDFDTRELLITHQQQGQPRVLDYRFGWLLLDDLLMQRHIKVGLRGSTGNYIQRRRIGAEPLN